LLHASEE